MLLTLLVLFVSQLSRGLQIDSDILDLLPESERSPVVQQALDQFAGNFAQRLIFLVGASSPAGAVAAADLAFNQLDSSQLFAELTYTIDADLTTEVFNTYYPYRAGLMSRADRQLFATANTEVIQQNAMAKLYSPVAPVTSQMLSIDPLFLLSNFLADTQHAVGGFTLYQNVLMAEHQQKHYVLISAELRESPFNIQLQEQLQPLLSKLTNTGPSTHWVIAGMPLHAMAATTLAKNEIRVIGGGSVLGIIVLIFWVFRSVKPIAVAILSIVIGVIAATAACLLIFGEIHILSLVFGASLVGVSIDYSFHYFAEHLGEEEQDVLAAIFPGISLGLVTSLIGYLALLVAPFPGLQQMAVFSSVGLLAAYITVVGLYPVLLQRKSSVSAARALQIAGGLVTFWQGIYQRQLLAKVLLVVMVVLAILLPQIKTSDDIRLLRSSPASILAMEDTVAAIVGTRLSSEFFLVTGTSEQQVLEREESLLSRLDDSRAVNGYQAVTQSLPSIERQIQQRQWLASAMLEKDRTLYRYLLNIGFEHKVIEDYATLLTAQPEYLAADQWLASPASSLHRQQWIDNGAGKGFASIVFLYDLDDAAMMREMASRMDGVEFVDQVNDVSQLFQQYRQLAVQAVIVAYGLIFILLLLRYPLRRAVLVMIPPVYAAAFAVAITVILGVSVNLFSVLALLLVLAIGIDYTLFYAESRVESRRKTALAIALSCTTTLLAFGLLALSDTPAIKSFGLTIAAGIALAFLLSPIASLDDEK